MPHLFIYKSIKDKETFIEDIITNYDVDGLECYHSEQTPEQMKRFKEIASELNLIITKGSDYHGPLIKPEEQLGTGINNNIVSQDDKEILESIQIYLKNEGFNIYKAYDGIQALDILLENEIHLILMDIMMPKLDGIKATIKIREEKNIPIILVSAKSEDTDKIIGLNIVSLL